MSNFKIGDKVICVSTWCKSITEGKEYVIEGVNNNNNNTEVLVRNNFGTNGSYFNYHFKKKVEEEKKVSRMIETTVTQRVKNTILTGYIRIKPNATGGSINLYYDNNHPYTSLAWLTKPELKKMIEDLQEVYEVLDEWE